LLVDPDTPKALEVPTQGFQSIAGRDRQILKRPGLMNHPQLAPRYRLDVSGKFPRTLAKVDSLSL